MGKSKLLYEPRNGVAKHGIKVQFSNFRCDVRRQKWNPGKGIWKKEMLLLIRSIRNIKIRKSGPLYPPTFPYFLYILLLIPLTSSFASDQLLPPPLHPFLASMSKTPLPLLPFLILHFPSPTHPLLLTLCYSPCATHPHF